MFSQIRHSVFHYLKTELRSAAPSLKKLNYPFDNNAIRNIVLIAIEMKYIISCIVSIFGTYLIGLGEKNKEKSQKTKTTPVPVFGETKDLLS